MAGEEKKKIGRPPNGSKKTEEKPKRIIDPDPVGNRVMFDMQNGTHLVGKILWMESNWIVLRAEKGSSIKFEPGEDKVFLIHGSNIILAEIL